MIEEYLKSKEINKEYQTLISWKYFYLECGNEFNAMKLDYKISRFEKLYF